MLLFAGSVRLNHTEQIQLNTVYSIGNLLYLVKERLASKPEASALPCFHKALASDLKMNTI